MRKIFKIMLLLIFGVFTGVAVSAQGALCSDIEPFCAGDERLTFPNSNETNSAQITGELGPDYGCLDEQPYPAWFFLQVENSGSLRFRISQTTNTNGTGTPLDVDFVVWGPFERGDEYCSGSSLNSSKIVDCSYLPDAVETMTIPDAQANEIYVVVITNFELIPGFISLEQVNDSGGSTDCSILDLDLGDNISVCDESEYILDGTTADASKYEWFVFNDSTAQFEVIPGEEGPTLTVNSTGRYKLIVTDEIEGKTEEDEVVVTFYNSPEIGEVSSLAVCDPEAEFIDLTENFEDLILPNNGDNSNYSVLYYETAEDVADHESISQPQMFPFAEGKTIYAEVVDLESGCSSEIEEFELTIFDFPEYDLSEISIFCVDREMQLLNRVSLGEDLGEGYFYEWRDGENIISTNPEVEFNELPESLQISVTVEHPESGCKIEFFSTVAPVSRPENVLIEVTGSDFGDGYTVIANPDDLIGEEYASFVYRLDDGNWRESNVFNDVPPGSHTVSVRELNGCGSTTSESFFLVGYPRFFTPNSDGYNDNWNLITDANISIKKLFVFDRYGKLITKIDPAQKGWDGTYNGSDLPSDDYWFRVEFIDEKTGEYREYMSNFTLMR
ncbi:T9SS type B sorting domain-containing protein [Christiangramia echinicola]|nr:T9SS type B sorting domain-containing protein [Christiangramia echinicola]